MLSKIEAFKLRALEVHKGKYDYSLWTFYGGTSKDYHTNNIPIICPIHGQFTNSLANHLRGSGCPTCGKTPSNKSATQRLSKLIAECTKIHGNSYDYSLIPAGITKDDLVSIKCPIHGIFKQKLANHINKKSKCQKCASAARATKLKANNDVDYSKLDNPEWLNDQHINKKLNLTEMSGILSVGDSTVGVYMRKNNIPTTRYPSSKGESEIHNFLLSIGIDDIRLNDRNIISPYELDLVSDLHKIAIEYCGLYWHSEKRIADTNYHKKKLDMTNANGYRLITVFEDEWLHKNDIVKSKLKNIFNKDDRKKIYARKCSIEHVNPNQKREFFNTTHIQGDGPSSINLGLFYDGVAVAIMAFSEYSDYYCLNRYATLYTVAGGFTKLLRNFLKEHNDKKIVSFADLRWSEGSVYADNGWQLEHAINPDYSYIVNRDKRAHKFGFRHKTLKNKVKYYDPHLTEHQNCLNNGIYRIYDCGKIKYSYSDTVYDG